MYKKISWIVALSLTFLLSQTAIADSWQCREGLKKTVEANRWGTQAHGNDVMKLVKVSAVIAKLEMILLNNFHFQYPLLPEVGEKAPAEPVPAKAWERMRGLE